MSTVDLSAETQSALLSFFTAYTQEYASAVQVATSRTLGQALQGPSAGVVPGVSTTTPKTITMRFKGAQAAPNTTNPVQTPGAPKTIASVTSTPVYTITFDIYNAPGVDAFPQRIVYGSSSRQQIQQTALGYHVDEWGLAPGTLSIESLVVFNTTPWAQIQSFFSFLQHQKATSPLSTSLVGGILQYFDAYMNRSFIITLESVEFTQVAEAQNMARLSMQASILKDYSGAPISVPVSQSGGLPNLSGGGSVAPATIFDFQGSNGPVNFS